MNFAHANIVSILIAAVAAWIFGGVYYTALSKPWLAAQGKTLEQCKAEQDAKSGIAKGTPFVVVFISEFIIAWVLYGILTHINHVRNQQCIRRTPPDANGHRQRRVAGRLFDYRRDSRWLGPLRAQNSPKVGLSAPCRSRKGHRIMAWS